MQVDYNDERFQQIERDKQAEIEANNSLYGNMINESNAYYDNLQNQVEDYGKKQQELQQQQTDFAIDTINQNKELAKQDYEKEQRGAYADYKQQSNNYGVNAERLAAQGLEGTGYSESSRVSMYNTYQNRYATARESFNRANLEYDNQIKEAQLTNNSNLAKIAYETLQNKLQLSLEGFQYRNGLLQQQVNAQNDITNRYYSRWKDTLAQINYENELAEQQRQFEEQMALSRSKSSGRSSGGSSGYTISNNGYTFNEDTTGSSSALANNGGYFIDNQGRVVTTDANGNVNIFDTSETKEKTTAKKKEQTNKDVKNQAIYQVSQVALNPINALASAVKETAKHVVSAVTSKNKKKK